MSEYPSVVSKLRAIDFAPPLLALLRPIEAPLTYAGVRVRGDRVPVYAFFDHTCRRIPYPARFAITTCRDWRGQQQTYDKHLGTDFMVPIGTRVVAAARGVVLRVGWEEVGGHFLWIDHGGGYSTTYHHLSNVLVHEGQQVHRGELIAKSGATGLPIETFFPLVPPHLHFSLVIDSVPADPFPGPDSPGFWADGRFPTPYTFDRALDLDLPYHWVSREAFLERFAQDPLLDHNFRMALEVLAPARYSDGGDWHDLTGRPRLQLTLPFSAEDFSGLSLS